MRSILKSVVILSVFAAPIAAHADTLGPFQGSGPGAVTTAKSADGSINTLAYDYTSTDVYNGVTYTYTGIATTTGTESFSFDATGDSAYYEATYTLSQFDANGTTQLINATPFGIYAYTGSSTLNLIAGQQYGFIVNASNYDSDDNVNGNIQIATTPEPSALVLLGTGVLSLASVARRRFSKTAS